MVLPEDTPRFEGVEIHPVCSTYKLAQEAEWAGRRVLLPLLESDEEGIGTAISLNHHAPAFVDECVEVRAWPHFLTGNKLICSFEARIGPRLLASGTTEQAVLHKTMVQKIFKN